MASLSAILTLYVLNKTFDAGDDAVATSVTGRLSHLVRIGVFGLKSTAFILFRLDCRA